MPSLMSHLTTRLNPGAWVSTARWPGPYWRCLGVVVLSYAMILGWFLASTKGLPYVLDNNETFSSLVHATNILRFGVRETFGLTDEAYGLDPAQHPYVYSHQGNFPRLYALLLYVLGAQTAEAQIVATTFTVGLVGLLFAYNYFSRVATPLFALVYCLLLVTDYVMQTQWLVNTWRTWHHFFVFSSLLCVHGLARRGRLPRWLVAITLLNFACLAYFELIFATFVTLWVTVYAGLICWGRPRRVFQSWLLVGGGAVLGAAVLAAQVIGYLGWDGFFQDARLTFLARNAAPTELSAFRRELWSFVEEHRLVFWDNIPGDVGSYRAAPALFRWCLLPYTPALVFVALLISGAWALSFVPAFDVDVVIVSGRSRRTWSARRAIPLALGAAALFVWATTTDASFAGFSDEDRWLKRVGAVIAGIGVIGLGLAVHRRLRKREDGLELPASRVMVASALLLVFSAFARLHPLLYAGASGAAFEPLFRELFVRSGGGAVWHLAVLLGGGVAVGLVLARRSLMGRERRRFKRLSLFLMSGVIAGVAIFFLSPGYVMTGYLMRYCPLTIYVHLIPFAATFYVLARLSLNSLKALGSSFRAMPLTTRSSEKPAGSEPRPAPGQHLFLSGGALLLFLLSGYWLMLQARYVAWLDPNAPLLKELQKPQYQSASFVVNTYAAPIAAITKGWAYFDPQMGDSELRNVEDSKFYLRRDFRSLWLADKRSNTKYFEPDYFVCWSLRNLLDPVPDRPQCQNVRIVAEARSGTSLLGHREVARDESRRDAWSIVKLNWSYPPGSQKRIQWHDRQYRRTLALPR